MTPGAATSAGGGGMTTPKRASYRDGVRWIAQNDEPGGQDVYTVAELVSVLLLADLFGKDPEAVAKAVVACRKREGRSQ